MKIDNYTNKPITEFNSEDTLYMQKILSGFMYTFLIKFKSFNKNIVTGEILDIQPNNFKSLWVKDHIPGTPLIFRQAKKKSEFAGPNKILIDDREDNINEWREAGGIGILFTSTGQVINELKTDPFSRRILLTTFNPSQVEQGVLYPCHSIVLQFYCRKINDNIMVSVKMYQRSADLFLGLPFNYISMFL